RFACAPGDVGQQRGESEQQGRRRQRESQESRDCAAPARAQEAEAESELAARRSGQELTKREQLRVLAVVDPAAPLDELAPEIREVSDRTAERGETELKKCRKDFAYAARATLHDRNAMLGTYSERAWSTVVAV